MTLPSASLVAVCSGVAQPTEALVAIRACVSLVPSMILLVSMAVLAGYRLPQDWVEGDAQRPAPAAQGSPRG